jgi:glycosyltransferase involved in cell wall biosynthesis
MAAPLVTIVIPTCNRPELLDAAVDSALSQTVSGLEVIVVDDGSIPPAEPRNDDERLHLIRSDVRRGVSWARNAGLAEARGRWIVFLDDDDQLVPEMVALSLEAARRSVLPPPVAVMSAIEVVENGRVKEVRLPVTSARGGHFGLGDKPPGRSFGTKETLLAPVEVLRAVGGWDESFRSRTMTELFLRLNPVCSLEAVDTVTLRVLSHGGPRLTGSTELRADSVRKLLRKHRRLFRRYPKAKARFLAELAVAETSLRRRHRGAFAAARSLFADPRRPHALREFVDCALPSRGPAVWKAVRARLVTLADRASSGS